MAKGEDVELEVADVIALDIAGMVRELLGSVEAVLIAGSIRRRRPVVHDLDLVVNCPERMKSALAALMLRLHAPDAPWSCEHSRTEKRVLIPAKFWKFRVNGLPVDVYLATPETMVTLSIVRTGSAMHNAKIAKEALDRGMKWHADGRGLEKDGVILPAASEAAVFQQLGMAYVKPEEREAMADEHDLFSEKPSAA